MTPNPLYKPMVVGQILDKFSLIVRGDGIHELKVDDRVLVVGVGGTVAGTNLRLVVPKAEVIVTLHAGEYVVAASEETEREHTTDPFTSPLIAALSKTTYTTNRAPMRVNEKQATGNPGNRPIEPGDYVVPVDEVPSFVRYISAEDAHESD